MSPIDNDTCAVKEKTCRAHISKVCSVAEVPEFFKELEIVTGTYVCIHTFHAGAPQRVFRQPVHSKYVVQWFRVFTVAFTSGTSFTVNGKIFVPYYKP